MHDRDHATGHDALLAKIDELQRRIDVLERERAAPPGTAPATGASRTDRRGAMRLAAGAAAGAVGAAMFSRTAAADDPDDVTLGSVKETGARPTGARYTGAQNGVGSLFAAGGTASGASAEYPAALGAWSFVDNMPNGLYGFSNQPGAAGVVGKNVDGDEGIGVRGIGDDTGVTGSSTPGIGVFGIGRVGGSFTGDDFGLTARCDRVGAAITGDVMTLYLGQDGGNPAPPADDQSGFPHRPGFVLRDDNDDLWYCTEPGTPGTWRKIAGPAAAGAFHPIGPYRMYDSRLDVFPLHGELQPGEDRNLDLADGRDAAGVVIAAEAVPEGATAISINLTVTGTTGPGFLAATPGDATEFTSSSINFWQADLSLANGLTVPLGPKRDMRIFCGPAATHVIVDVNGYYR